MKPIVAVIAPGNMGAAIGGRLVECGVAVLTSLGGRGPATAKRADDAGLRAVEDAQIADAAFILSIVPPAAALSFAERLVPVLSRAAVKPVYVDCNAVSPETVRRIAAVIQPTGCGFVDAGIIGGPPRQGYMPAIYAAGVAAASFRSLTAYGLDIRLVDGPIGAASALKMSYAGITKGLQALGAAMLLAADRSGVAEDLRQELTESQPMLSGWLQTLLPGMYAKSYRWVAEMEEIAAFAAADPGAAGIYTGAARLFERLAEDFAGPGTEVAALDRFCSATHPRANDAAGAVQL